MTKIARLEAAFDSNTVITGNEFHSTKKVKLKLTLTDSPIQNTSPDPNARIQKFIHYMATPQRSRDVISVSKSRSWNLLLKGLSLGLISYWKLEVSVSDAKVSFYKRKISVYCTLAQLTQLTLVATLDGILHFIEWLNCLLVLQFFTEMTKAFEFGSKLNLDSSVTVTCYGRLLFVVLTWACNCQLVWFVLISQDVTVVALIGLSEQTNQSLGSSEKKLKIHTCTTSDGTFPRSHILCLKR